MLPRIDGLVLEHILSWLISDVTSAVRMASVCSSWRRAVMDHLHYEGARIGYGVLKITVTSGMVAIMKAYGRYIGEIVSSRWGPTQEEWRDLRAILEKGTAPNLRALTSPCLDPSGQLWASLPRLVRLGLSDYHSKDEDLSLCCEKLPHLTELLVQSPEIKGEGWLDNEEMKRPWRVLRLERTRVPFKLVAAVCTWARVSLVELGFSEDYAHRFGWGIGISRTSRGEVIENLHRAINSCSNLRELHLSELRSRDIQIGPFPANLHVLCLRGGSIEPGFFYKGLIPCDRLHRFGMTNIFLSIASREIKDMFRWLGSHRCMRWVDLSGSTIDDEYFSSFLQGLETVSPARLYALRLPERSITNDMLCDLLKSCPNIAHLDLNPYMFTDGAAELIHGLLSKRIRRLPNDDVEIRCPVHGTSVVKAEDLSDGAGALLDAGEQVWEMRTEPTNDVEIVIGDGCTYEGIPVRSFCKKSAAQRCNAEALSKLVIADDCSSDGGNLINPEDIWYDDSY
ncbi:hypothetical protein FOZ63_007621 [Perkinsus olseni]|uniref:F-box domain-containing protein n=1 Tax=Perkinsus olseni TaxID=32597 RepID=A0A7J6U717_PEROL|nr:hypothetical protein FOZ60_000981 [Perkinsus olseni]KAF4753353.1 hypothetical protein FOZ62_026105 [Perkinsus olseni]KAF4754030.1 hypothetical protein FOZ63_007621 [Perkinsus olseni]